MLVAAFIVAAPGVGCYQALASGTIRPNFGRAAPISPYFPAGLAALGADRPKQVPLVQPSDLSAALPTPRLQAPSAQVGASANPTASPALDVREAGVSAAAPRPARPRVAASTAVSALPTDWKAWLSSVRAWIPSQTSLSAMGAEQARQASERSMDAVLRQSSLEGAWMAAAKGPVRSRSLEPIDPDSDEGLLTPGLDERMLPVIGALKTEIESKPEKYERLGHLGRALQEFLRRGGVIRYANLSQNEFSTTPGYYDASVPAIYLDNWNMRLAPFIQAAAMVPLLQQAADSMKGRVMDTRDAPIRQDLALAAFLEDVDLKAWAQEVHVNNPAYVAVFEGMLDRVFNANFGLSILRRVHNKPTRAHWLRRRRREIARLKRQREKHLKLARGRRLVAESMDRLNGRIVLAQASLEMAEREFSPEGARPSALSMGDERARIRMGSLPIVRMRPKPQIHPRLARAIDILKRAIEGRPDRAMRELGYDADREPAVRDLGHLITALDDVLKTGGRLFCARFMDPDLFTVFSRLTSDIVLGLSFMNIEAAVLAMLLVHELSHAHDYFADRPMTLESEMEAYIAMARLAGAFDPEKIAARMDPRDSYNREAYEYVYGARDRYLRSQRGLAAYIRGIYAPTEAEAKAKQKFEMRQTAAERAVPIEAKRDEVLKKKADIERQIAHIEQAQRDGANHAAWLIKLRRALALCEASVLLYERMLAPLRAERPFPAASRP